jgi:transcriptional regulator with XRE-family HTH domain
MKAETIYQLDRTKLKSLRKTRRYTLAEVGAMIGVSKAQYQQWEAHGIPTIKTLLKICAALKVSPYIFFVKTVFHSETQQDIQG